MAYTTKIEFTGAFSPNDPTYHYTQEVIVTFDHYEYEPAGFDRAGRAIGPWEASIELHSVRWGGAYRENDEFPDGLKEAIYTACFQKIRDIEELEAELKAETREVWIEEDYVGASYNYYPDIN